jgi:hypothetical protein
MKRREFIKAAAATAIGLTPRHTAFATDSPKQDNRPNILFIMTDRQSILLQSRLCPEPVQPANGPDAQRDRNEPE